ncbi:MAG: metallophosphoesterase [Syntrophomonadaceae bacterium]|nr:metallophosphoesterase [Syntrophomonadaceae bacterium]MDD3023480.1 metallophosphoesterase [Syntrophomonadaceae bacterium]
MRIAVLGDTHAKIDKVRKELQKLKPEYLLFTGDHFADAKKIASHLRLEFSGVAGNCDPRSTARQEEVLELAGKRFYLVHGHQYGVKKSLNSLYFRGQELKVDAVIFGHTHIPLCEKFDGMWIINPGSPSLPRFGNKGSYVLMEIKDGLLIPQIMYL